MAPAPDPRRSPGDDPRHHLPLSPRVFHVLLALTDGARHGYRLMQEVEAASGGRVRVAPGTLYEAIHSLQAKGLVAESEKRPDPAEDDPRRRYWRLTAAGRRVLEAEAVRLAELVEQARDKRLLESPGEAR